MNNTNEDNDCLQPNIKRCTRLKTGEISIIPCLDNGQEFVDNITYYNMIRGVIQAELNGWVKDNSE